MRKSSVSKIVAILLVLSFSFSTFADLKIENFFNGLDPQKHINKIYPEERKNELKKTVISYDDIEDMIHLFNPDILNSWNTWENNKSSQDVYNDYIDAADALSTGGSSEVADAMANAQADAMRIQADKNADDSYTNFLTNYLTEKKLVLSTKLMDIAFHKSDYDLLVANENLAEAKRKLETAKNAYAAGSGTRVDYLTAEKALADAESALIIATSAQKTNKRNMIVNCGKSMNDDITIMPVNIAEGVDLSKCNLEVDYKKALSNNIQFEIYRRRLENARTDEVKNEYKILLDAAPQNIYNDLESKFATILDTIETINNKDIAYKLTLETLAQAKNNLSTGNISQKEYMTAQYNVNVAKANYEAARYDLKTAFENYLASVNGFGSC